MFNHFLIIHVLQLYQSYGKVVFVTRWPLFLSVFFWLKDSSFVQTLYVVNILIILKQAWIDIFSDSIYWILILGSQSLLVFPSNLSFWVMVHTKFCSINDLPSLTYNMSKCQQLPWTYLYHEGQPFLHLWVIDLIIEK